MTAPELLVDERRIAFQVGNRPVPMARFSLAELLRAVEAYDEAVRVPGLPDELAHLNVDPDKVRAFVEALPRLDASSLDLLSGRRLLLSSRGLQLDGWTAVTSARIRAGFRIEAEADAPAPGIAAVRMALVPDTELALRRIEQARSFVAERDAQLAQLPSHAATAQANDAIVLVRAARLSAVYAWSLLAGELSERRPPVAGAAGLREAANEAARGAGVAPSWFTRRLDSTRPGGASGPLPPG